MLFLRIALSKNIKCYLPNINVVDYFDKKEYQLEL